MELKKTALNKWHKENGAKMVDFGGWEMPIQYKTGIFKEHLSTRKYAGLFDVSHMGTFSIKGKNSVAFLQHTLSNNVEKINEMEAQYTLIANELGELLDDAYLYCVGKNSYLLVVNASNREKDWKHLKKYSQNYKDLVIEDITFETSIVAFQGPISQEVLEKIITSGTLPKKRNTVSRAEISGAEILIARTGYTGEPIGFEIFISPNKTELVWNIINNSNNNVIPIGLGARDTLRLEAKMPLYGHELGTTPDGKEIPAFAFYLTKFAVDFSSEKGDFVGKEELYKQYQELKLQKEDKTYSSKYLPKVIRSILLHDRGIARRGNLIFKDNKEIGVIVSGSAVPYWKFNTNTNDILETSSIKTIAFAYINSSVEIGTNIEIEVRNRHLKASVIKKHGNNRKGCYFISDF